MDQPTKIRRACDRCHTQKLRCKRIEGHNTCVRCANANLTCIFSPPGKNHKQHPGRKQSVGAAPNRQKSALSSTQNDPGVVSNGLIDIDKRPADYSQLPPVTTLQQWPTSQPEDDILLNCETTRGLEGYDLDALADASDVAFNIHWDNFSNSSLPEMTLSQGSTEETLFAPGAMTSITSPATSGPSSAGHNLLSTERLNHISVTHPLSRITSPQSFYEDNDTHFIQQRNNGQELLDGLPIASPQGMATWVSKLAEINISLLNLSTHVPGPEITHSQYPQPGSRNEREQVFAIDRAFLLSKQLIDLLNQVFPRFVDRSNNLDLAASSDIKASPKTSKHIRTLDPASDLLVLSCHLRVLEIYGKIFLHIENSIKQHRAPEQIRLPGLAIGAFSLHSSCGLQLTIFIHLAEILLSRLRDVMVLMDTTSATGDGARHETQDHVYNDPSVSLDQVVDVTLQAIKAREVETIKIVLRMKRSLEQSGML